MYEMSIKIRWHARSQQVQHKVVCIHAILVHCIIGRSIMCNSIHTVLFFVADSEFTGCLFGPDAEWNIEWPNTVPDTTATQPCPGELDSVSGT